MSDNNHDLANYYDKLDEVFSSFEMSEGAREAAVYDFTQHVRRNRLSMADAIALLGDNERVAKFCEIGIKADASTVLVTGESEKFGVDPTALIIALSKGFHSVRTTVENIASMGEKTNDLLSRVEQAATYATAEAADNKKMLGEIRAVAGSLKQDIAIAMTSTKEIVPKLETISSHLDAQLQKLDKEVQATKGHASEANGGIKVVKGQTDPDKTHKDGFKLMLHSVAWGTIASTLCGAGVGALINHYAAKHDYNVCKDTETRIETRIVEKEVCPSTSWTLSDIAGKTVYTLKPVPSLQPDKKKIKALPATPL
ncbi:MAG: hypothetical protein WC612_07555 [Bdellovibrionales bacterium]|jgi:hypothetical protein